MVTYGQPSTDYGRTFITILAIFFFIIDAVVFSRVQRDNCELRVGRCYVWCGVELLCVVWEPTWLWSQQRRRALKL